VLKVRDLAVEYQSHAGRTLCVDGASLDVGSGEVVGLVGESGCGKSLTALGVLGLLGKNGRIARGSVEFEGRELTTLDPESLRRLRGSSISMVFQEPMTSLNPVLTLGAQLLEPIRLHLGLGRTSAKRLALDWLDKVGLPRPESVYREYPGTLSGGMRQRVMIAAAMVCRPKLLIADEPTTALDVTVQKQILDLMEELISSTGSALLLITHDLGIVAERTDRVAVMYAGRIVEEGKTAEVFDSPLHPYTRGLLDSVPDLRGGSVRLLPIPGNVPVPGRWPSGCPFRDRCTRATLDCGLGPAPRAVSDPGHAVRCRHPLKASRARGVEVAYV